MADIFVDNYLKTTYVDEDVSTEGTPDLEAVNLNKAEDQVKALSASLASTTVALDAVEDQVSSMGNPYVDTTFITGLALEWVSGTQIRVKSGACYIPAAGLVAEATADVTLTPTIAASTMYYVYGIAIGETLSFVVSTTAPVQYRGIAKHESANSSRRYIGAFKTDATPRIWSWSWRSFSGSAADVFYTENTDIDIAPWSWANNSTFPAGSVIRLGITNATPAQRLVPPSSKLAHCVVQHLNSTMTWQNSEDALSDASGVGHTHAGVARSHRLISLNSSQEFIISSPSASGAYGCVIGYREER